MAEDEDLKERLAETEAELRAMRDRLGSALIEKDQLERRAEKGGGVPSAALDRIERRLRDIEHRFDENVSRLIDDGRARDSEIRALTDEVAALRRSRDDAVGSLKVLEHACKVLALRLHKIESGGKVKAPIGQAGAGQAVTARLEATTSFPGVTPPPEVPKPRPTPTVTRAPLKAPTADAPIHVSAASMSVSDVAGLVQFEDRPELREPVRGLATRWSIAYHRFEEGVPDEPGERMLLVNLLGTAAHPLEVLTAVEPWRSKPLRGFVYLSDGTHGTEIGLTDILPPPIEEDECVEYFLSRSQRPQRLLVASEKFEFMSHLRDRLAAQRCTVSMAFDGRQALDLAPMVKPDLVLLDLNLPKGEALRLLVRLRANVVTSRLPFTLIWEHAIGADELRDQVRRAIRDVAFSEDDLVRGVSRALTPAKRGSQAAS